MNPRKHQVITIDVTSAGQEVTIDSTTSKLYQKVTGIAASVPAANLVEMYFSAALAINNEEIFPEGYELNQLTTGQEVPPNDKYYSLNEEAHNSSITGKIKDNTAALGFTAYKIRIYLRLENPVKSNNSKE